VNVNTTCDSDDTLYIFIGGVYLVFTLTGLWTLSWLTSREHSAHWRTLQPLVAPSLMCGLSTDSCYILHTILIDHCKHTNILMTEFLLYRNWIRLDALQSLPPHNREGGMLPTNITGWDIFPVHLPCNRVPSWTSPTKRPWQIWPVTWCWGNVTSYYTTNTHKSL